VHLDLTEEQAMIRDLAREFADKEVRPIAEAIDRDAHG
jgi:alkylation response protein AidB-like acyl-CoA dehydrogenase